MKSMSFSRIVENSALLAPETLARYKTAVVIAPHPDDESLGCAGAIAALRAFGCKVFVITISDGALSHPNSQKYPFAKLRDLRERETLRALEILAVENSNAVFLRYPDRSVPNSDSPDFAQAVARAARLLEEIKPQIIFAPWRRDPHPDHRAAFQIVAAACAQTRLEPRVVEYPIWLWELETAENAPRPDEITAWRLDIARFDNIKQQAIRAHVSQTTDLIDDDPAAFRLTPEILRHFARGWEIFLESAV